MVTWLPETCRVEINIHEKLCVNLVIYKDRTRVHGQQNTNWFLTFRKEHKLSVFKYRVLRKTSGRKRHQVTGENFTTRRFTNCIPLRIVIRAKKSRKVRRRSMWHVWRSDVHTGFWWGNLRERDHLEGLGVDGRTQYSYETCVPQTGRKFFLVEKKQLASKKDFVPGVS